MALKVRGKGLGNLLLAGIGVISTISAVKYTKERAERGWEQVCSGKDPAPKK